MKQAKSGTRVQLSATVNRADSGTANSPKHSYLYRLVSPYKYSYSFQRQVTEEVTSDLADLIGFLMQNFEVTDSNAEFELR
jgi:hypothetical protein